MRPGTIRPANAGRRVHRRSGEPAEVLEPTALERADPAPWKRAKADLDATISVTARLLYEVDQALLR